MWSASFLFLFLLFDLENLGAFVISAVRANAVRNIQVMAVGTFRKVLRREREMTAATVSAAFGKFSFWERWHVTVLLDGAQCPADDLPDCATRN